MQEKKARLFDRFLWKKMCAARGFVESGVLHSRRAGKNYLPGIRAGIWRSLAVLDTCAVRPGEFEFSPENLRLTAGVFPPGFQALCPFACPLPRRGREGP